MTLTDCRSYYLREAELRLTFFDTEFPWEQRTGGTPAAWSPTTFRACLHKTADPGETGDTTTNAADFTGYVEVSVARSTSGWEITGAGTANPIIRNKTAITSGENTGSSQDVYAASLAMRDGSSNVPMARDAFTAVPIATNQTPNLSAQQFEYRLR
jgi:hypothetical protein